MVLPGGGLSECGESLAMSSMGALTTSGPVDRGAINTLGCTRAESRTGGVGAFTATLLEYEWFPIKSHLLTPL